MIQERDDIVALDSAIIQHPRTWEASGHLAGFSDPLVQCLGKCKKRFRLDHLQEAAVANGEDPETVKCPRVRRRPDRAARVQPDVPDEHRAGPGRGLDRLPAPGDRAGHLPRLQDDAAVRAQEAAVRHRADRQVLPQRDHARQLHLPHARVRADGDGVLRPARRGAAVVRVLVPGAPGLVRRGSASTASACACARTTRRSSRTTRPAPATSSTCTRSAGPSSRASPTAATSTSPSTRSSRGEKLEWKDPQTGEGYLPHVIEPAAGARPHDARAAVRGLRRGRDRRREAHRAAPAPVDGADQGRRAAAAAQGRPPREGARDLRGRCAGA